MKTLDLKENLQVQLIQLNEVLATVVNSRVMKLSIECRIAKLQQELDELIASKKDEPNLRILFSGNAVFGSQGIKASVAGTTLRAVNNFFKEQNRFNNWYKNRTKRKSPELYFIEKKTGSFGFELGLLDQNELFDSEIVETTIKQFMYAIGESSKSDDAFSNLWDKYSEKALKPLKELFECAAKEDSILKIESGLERVYLTKDVVSCTYDRISKTQYKEEKKTSKGYFYGILIESGNFEIKLLDTEKVIKGKISPDIEGDVEVAYNKELTNELCTVTYLERCNTFPNGKTSTIYELIHVSK